MRVRPLPLPRRRARPFPHGDAIAIVCASALGIQPGVLGKLDSVYDYAVRNRQRQPRQRQQAREKDDARGDSGTGAFEGRSAHMAQK
ncbi:hypothetical protein DFH11DRAFT_1734627 [Phellopilus nigrolimitatus]|nr:hypothetical protein DFH11DRAFT_1734627 [Phellopilus nigrolimitatus]